MVVNVPNNAGINLYTRWVFGFNQPTAARFGVDEFAVVVGMERWHNEVPDVVSEFEQYGLMGGTVGGLLGGDNLLFVVADKAQKNVINGGDKCA